MTKTSLIGIMADSHGKPDTIAAAVALFKSKDCLHMYHLGDICDSVHPETVESCVSMLKANNVAAIKGNNDHAVSINNSELNFSVISRNTSDYLSALPLVAEYGEAIFTHSLPFVETLGLSCMIRSMGKNEAAFFFKEHPGKILFRGHGHSPEILSNESGEMVVRSMFPGEDTVLASMFPCIITCGSLAAGYCMIWKPDEKSVKCYSI